MVHYHISYIIETIYIGKPLVRPYTLNQPLGSYLLCSSQSRYPDLSLFLPFLLLLFLPSPNSRLNLLRPFVVRSSSFVCQAIHPKCSMFLPTLTTLTSFALFTSTLGLTLDLVHLQRRGPLDFFRKFNDPGPVASVPGELSLFSSKHFI